MKKRTPKPVAVQEVQESIKDLLRLVLRTEFFAGPDAPLRGVLTEGDAQSRVALIVGPNASGKSFVADMLGAWVRNEKPSVDVLPVSMRSRTRDGMHRCFMYGPRGDNDSTGNVSTIALRGGLRTARERTSPCLLQLDEPDLGLAEEFGWAMGQWIAQDDPTRVNDQCRGMVVVSHSRELVRGFLEASPLKPHFLHLGDNPQTLDDWLKTIERRSVDDLKALSDVSHERFLSVLKLLEA